MSTQAKPTPGPWTEDWLRGQISGAHGETVVMMRVKMNAADARLIAAAPALHEALSEMLKEAEGLDDDALECAGIGVFGKNTLEKARSALLKAKKP